MSKTTLPNGNTYPTYNDEVLSWSPGLYFTQAEAELDYPRTRAVLSELCIDDLYREAHEELKATFGIFRNNAAKMLKLIQDEIDRRQANNV